MHHVQCSGRHVRFALRMQVQAAPPMYAAQPMVVPRVQQHVQTLGIMWCAYGAYRALSGKSRRDVHVWNVEARFLGSFGARGNFP